MIINVLCMQPACVRVSQEGKFFLLHVLWIFFSFSSLSYFTFLFFLFSALCVVLLHSRFPLTAAAALLLLLPSFPLYTHFISFFFEQNFNFSFFFFCRSFVSSLSSLHSIFSRMNNCSGFVCVSWAAKEEKYAEGSLEAIEQGGARQQKYMNFFDTSSKSTDRNLYVNPIRTIIDLLSWSIQHIMYECARRASASAACDMVQESESLLELSYDTMRRSSRGWVEFGREVSTDYYFYLFRKPSCTRLFFPLLIRNSHLNEFCASRARHFNQIWYGKLFEFYYSLGERRERMCCVIRSIILRATQHHHPQRRPCPVGCEASKLFTRRSQKMRFKICVCLLFSLESLW